MYTIRDVAKISGVSKSTVSRVLNNHPYVSFEKRKRVEEAIKQLEFKPNQIARHFRTKRTNSIGIIVSFLAHPYFSELAGALSEECRIHGYNPVLFQTFGDRTQEMDVFKKWKSKELDALIVTSTALTQAELDELSDNGVLTICNEAYTNNKIDVFCLNEKKAAYEGVQHLLNKGRKKVAFCSDDLASPSQQARLSGFKQAHLEMGLTWDDALIVDNISSVTDGYSLGKYYLSFSNSRAKTIDAVFAGSDFVASGFLKAAQHYGVEVPLDFSIIGFDNHPISEVTSPPITTIMNQTKDMAQDLVEVLDMRLLGQDRPFMFKQYNGILIVKGTT
ncbi:LacI family DNA-binding transcriptional regulator [Alkalicoccobacillus gibsonii]|uniref:LacI family DNA-binding transcriptional regulator n=1 Tax=Alkalicoccobacillus gibsonii TaxID=79881 RepID=UPI0019332D48|nr:LacI family DNA-binding transcriptional regulator [Alkalicoccobacillus gibsonii]MBM0066353.1 LacI family DNA-binding transcriptional regulator [Alkalicoccobacillus gibsonii]